MKYLFALLVILACCLGASAQPIQRNYFTTNVNPQVNITNGNLFSTNIYVSNIFATNITVQNITNINEFRGRTVITTNLFATNTFITYLTNITAYVTNLFAVTEYVTNLNVTYLTNQTFYTTNLFATTVNAVTNINNFDITTNLFVSNVFATNITVDLITNNSFFTTNIFATTVNATTNFNTFNFSTNLFSTNIITTNLFATYITNDISYITNLFSTNIITTNLFATTINATTNINNFSFTTNLITSNIFTTNITLMEAIWDTNRWNGPTNDVSFKATYQKYVTSTDMEITGLIDSSASNANTSVVLIDPGGATRTLYFPAVFTNYTSDGNNAYTIPSTNIALVTLFQYGNQNTNVVVRLFGPGTGTPAPVAQVWTNENTEIHPVGLQLAGVSPSVTAIQDPDTGGNVAEHFQFGTFQNVSGQRSILDFVGISNTNTADTTLGLLAYGPGPGPDIFLEAFDDAANGEFAQIKLTTYDTKGPITIRVDKSAGPVITMNGAVVLNTTSNHMVGTLTASGFTDDAFAANGVVTNDSTGLLHTTPTLPSTLLPTDLAYTDKNNAFTTASSNYVAMTVTTSTNQNQVTPDFSVPEQLMSTNAAFTFLAPVGVDTTKTTVQWTLVNVTNTTAAAVLITSPANCHTVGTAYVTNLTAVWFQCYAQKFTNAFYIPVF